jgi:rRNA maturation protein Nop10
VTDFPFDDVAREAVAWMKKGHTIFQKFTCARCGSRQTMSEPNRFFMRGRCEQCGSETDILRRGCNYAVICSVEAVH